MQQTNQPDTISIAEIEIRYTPKYKVSDLPQIKRSGDLYHLLLHSWDKSKLEFVEQFKVVLINRASRILGICTLSTGSGSGTIADPKLVFAVALKANATSVILAHNHPSGNLMPSESDKAMTQKMAECGKWLDLKVLDHLIVTTEGYYSFADEGAMLL